MSGSGDTITRGSAITALNFGATPFSLPFTVFMPIQWATGNTNGATLPNGSWPFQADTTAYGTGITPDLLAASQANLAAFSNQALATISNVGAFQFGTATNIFQGWGKSLDALGQHNAAILDTAVSNAAAQGWLNAAGNFIGNIAKAFVGFV